VTSRKLVKQTLDFGAPERVPRHIWVLPWAEDHYPSDVGRLRAAFPDDIVSSPEFYKTPPRTTGEKYRGREFIDEWGCKFSSVQDGIIGVVKDPLISDWSKLEDFQPPVETLTVNREAVNAFCRSTDKFVLSSGPGARPFERFQFIRTMEQALMDLVLAPPEMVEMLRRIHEHYCKEVEVWAQTEVDGIAMMDDWGMQEGMLVPPDVFRRYFKPMYRDYAEIAKHFGKYVFMHSDGWITEIVGDLIEVGIDALNSQLFCMDIGELGRRFREKITFWGEIDRQQLLPHGSREDIREAVRTVYDNLYAEGGVIAQCEFGPGAKPENVFAVFDTWDEISATMRTRLL
jgi:uroporphyrinogen decarboxylase